MKTIEIQTPDGKTIELQAPDNATPEMIQQKAMQAKEMYIKQNPQKPQNTDLTDSMEVEQTLRLATNSMNPLPLGQIPPELGKQLKGIPRLSNNEVADMLGEKVAEEVGGIPGAALGTGISMVPRVADTAYTVAAAGGPRGLLKAGIKGGKFLKNLKNSFTLRSAAQIGKELGDVERSAGARLPVMQEPLVKVGRTADKARVEIDRIARTIGRVDKASKEVGARWLARQKDRLDLILSKFTKTPNTKDNLGKDAVVKASQLRSEIVKRLNRAIPKRKPLAREYKAAMDRNKLLKKAGGGAIVAGTVYGGYKGLKGLFKR